MLILILFTSYQPRNFSGTSGDVPGASDVLAISQARCTSCHASQPSDPDFSKAPNGVRLETIGDLRKYSEQIMKQAVLTGAMPLANRTRMTRKERDIIGFWIRAGMPGDN